MSAAIQSSRATEARPGTLVAAVALTALSAIGSLASLPLMPDEAPDAIIPISIAFAVVSLLGAWHLWHGRRWAAILLFVVTAFNGLSSAPGVLEADEGYNKVLAGIGVVLAVVVCALLLQRSTRAVLR